MCDFKEPGISGVKLRGAGQRIGDMARLREEGGVGGGGREGAWGAVGEADTCWSTTGLDVKGKRELEACER